MSDWIKRIPFSKKGYRVISPFVGHELLYDYINGGLDEERRKAIEEHLALSREAQLDLEKIQEGIRFCQEVGHLEIKESFSEKYFSNVNSLPQILSENPFVVFFKESKMWVKVAILVFLILIFSLSAVIKYAPLSQLSSLFKTDSSIDLVTLSVDQAPENSETSLTQDLVKYTEVDLGTFKIVNLPVSGEKIEKGILGLGGQPVGSQGFAASSTSVQGQGGSTDFISLDFYLPSSRKSKLIDLLSVYGKLDKGQFQQFDEVSEEVLKIKIRLEGK